MSSSHIHQLTAIFNRIPRRHTTDNVKEMYSIVTDFEDVLLTLEANPAYEKLVADFFSALDPIRASIKKSTENKASKKQKDDYFDEASVAFKNTVEDLMNVVK